MSEIPHSTDAEASVVGQMLADPRIVGEVAGTLLDPEHFYVPAFRRLYGTIVEAYYADDPIDPLSIGVRCRKTLARTWDCTEQEAVAEVQGLASGQQGAAGEAPSQARVIKRNADYRQLVELAAAIQRKVQLEESSPDEVAADASHTAMKIATSTLLTQAIVPFDDLGREYIKEQRTMIAAAAAGIDLGAYFRLHFFDRWLRGLRPAELWFLAGEPGAGKSAVSWVAAQKFTPPGTERPPKRMAGEHSAQAPRVIEKLREGHREVLNRLLGVYGMTENELRYQRRKRNPDLGPIEPDLDELEAAGLVELEVSVRVKLTSEGNRRLEMEQLAPAAA